MRFRRLSIAAIALLGAAACGPGDGPVPFSIQLRLSDRLGDGCAPSATCHDYGMSCGAKLGIRIVDAESIYEASRQPDASPGSDAGPELDVVAEECVNVPAADTLCGVDEVSVTFPEVPARMMQIQVALWGPDTPGDQDCPKNLFDVQGQPLLEAPQPAFGGANYFDVGSEPVATVSLACRDPEQLDALECQTEKTSVTAFVTDMSDGIRVSADVAGNLAVSAGEPREDTEAEEDPVWVLNPSDAHDLTLVGALPWPYWAAEELPSFLSAACVLVLDRLPPQAVTSVACERVVDLAPQLGEPLDLNGLLLPDDVLDEIMAAAGLGDIFPNQGLVVGRVVNEVDSPLHDVEVRTNDTSATIEYLSADLSATTTDKTTTSGYFISRDAEWGSLWTAEHTICHNLQDGNYVAGLIEGKVTVLVIRMTPFPEGCVAAR